GGLPSPSWRSFAEASLVALTTCGILGFVIERFAYRPLRDKPRINSLITAIGISLLLEYGGQHKSVFGPTPQRFPIDLVPWLGGDLTTRYVLVSRIDAIILLITVLIMAALTLIVLKTKTGLA